MTSKSIKNTTKVTDNVVSAGLLLLGGVNYAFNMVFLQAKIGLPVIVVFQINNRTRLPIPVIIGAIIATYMLYKLSAKAAPKA